MTSLIACACSSFQRMTAAAALGTFIRQGGMMMIQKQRPVKAMINIRTSTVATTTRRFTSSSMLIGFHGAAGGFCGTRGGIGDGAQADTLLHFQSNSFSSSSTAAAVAASTTTSPTATALQTSHLLKELRARTGAPMVECKKALSAEDVQGDVDKATDWLRKYGSAKAASKLIGREAKEGLIGMAISPDYSKASLVQVACETDFSARSQSFIHLVDHVAQSALNSCSSSPTTSPSPSPSSSNTNTSQILHTETLLSYSSMDKSTQRSVKDILDETVLAIRENLHIVKALSLHVPSSSSQAIVTGYIHGKLSNHAGTCAALVTLLPTSTCTLSKDGLLDVGKKLAMHIVAAKPLYLSPTHIPQATLDKERDIFLQQMNLNDSTQPPQQQQQQKKSQEIQNKIIMGKMNKFYQQVCLTEQEHMIQEGNPKIIKYLQGLGIEVITYEACFIH